MEFCFFFGKYSQNGLFCIILTNFRIHLLTEAKNNEIKKKSVKNYIFHTFFVSA